MGKREVKYFLFIIFGAGLCVHTCQRVTLEG